MVACAPWWDAWLVAWRNPTADCIHGTVRVDPEAAVAVPGCGGHSGGPGYPTLSASRGEARAGSESHGSGLAVVTTHADRARRSSPSAHPRRRQAAASPTMRMTRLYRR